MVCLQTIKAEGIECGWKRVDGYLFPTSPDQTAFNKLDGEMSAYVRAGQSDVRKVRHSLETPPSTPLLRTKHQSIGRARQCLDFCSSWKLAQFWADFQLLTRARCLI